jgi:hypothetical protein
MMGVFWSIVQLIVYSVLFIFLVVLALKIVGSIFSANFEKEIVENRNIGLSLILSSLLIALAILFSSVIK